MVINNIKPNPKTLLVKIKILIDKEPQIGMQQPQHHCSYRHIKNDVHFLMRL